MNPDNRLVGQWIGSFEGFPGGFVTFNVEGDKPRKAFACLVQSAIPLASRFDFDVVGSGPDYEFTLVAVRTFSPELGRLLDRKDYETRYKEQIVFPSKGSAFARLHDDELSGTWESDILPPLKFTTRKSAVGKVMMPDRTLGWPEFREYISDTVLNGAPCLFRGQSNNQWPLRSSLHRMKRFDLERYRHGALPDLAKHLNTLCPEPFDLDDPKGISALLSLAQHHGFPTPLVDWTRSPYIAAYFALDGADFVEDGEGACRIFVLQERWWNETYQDAHLDDPAPVVAVREFPARHNPRHLPQQSTHTFVNVDDVASWIRLNETEAGREQYLSIIDIPWSERGVAMRDLELMGVTAASLFPGLDGTCRAIKDRHFRNGGVSGLQVR